jgi:RHS repeat-associated protein
MSLPLSALSVTCPSTFFFSPAEKYTTRANAIKRRVEMIPIKVQQEGKANPWKFAAGYLDSSTNLYKFGTRYYDPTLGRWTQQDPVGGSLGDLNSANRYTYANDDPVNAVDPSGKDIIGCTLAVLLVALGFAAGIAAVVGAVATAPEVLATGAVAAASVGATVGTYSALIGGGIAIIAAWVGVIQTAVSGVCS